jgi:DNA-directed RNA polymerase sigma subunit (sigma70/sigma32)
LLKRKRLLLAWGIVPATLSTSGESRTYDVTAAFRLGQTRERVGQIEVEALSKLRVQLEDA